jgi:AcrR family transcriptional regulator
MTETFKLTQHSGRETGSADDRERRRISAAERRERLLDVAARVFASRGLRGTTTAVLAERAGVSEPVLYDHFDTKDRLFRETVERNIDQRIQVLETQLTLMHSENLIRCVEILAEKTVSVCLTPGANALLTNWALLEAPEYAVDLYRGEAGSVTLMWERKLAECNPRSELVPVLRGRLLPYAIQACLAYGFWLTTLRHTPESAAPVARAFAAGIARLASTLVRSEVFGSIHNPCRDRQKTLTVDGNLVNECRVP